MKSGLYRFLWQYWEGTTRSARGSRKVRFLSLLRFLSFLPSLGSLLNKSRLALLALRLRAGQAGFVCRVKVRERQKFLGQWLVLAFFPAGVEPDEIPELHRDVLPGHQAHQTEPASWAEDEEADVRAFPDLLHVDAVGPLIPRSFRVVFRQRLRLQSVGI